MIPLPPYVDIADFTAEYLKKRFLIGFKFVDGEGRELDDTIYEQYIAEAAAQLETLLGITILPVEVVDEKHDYFVTDYINYAFIPLYKWPVRVVKTVSVHYSQERQILVYPREWVRANLTDGQLQLIPTLSQSAPLAYIGAGGLWAPFILNIYSDKFPQYWYVSYSAGFDNKIPADIAGAIFRLAVTELYITMGVTAVPIGVGNESVSVDGLSQSRGYNEPFKPVLDRYNKWLYGDPSNPQDNGVIRALRDRYKGIMVESL